MSLNPILQFLRKFESLRPRDESLKKTIVSVFKKEMLVDVSLEDINVQRGVAHIKANPVIKNEIFLRKNSLINAIEKEVGAGTLKDLR